MKKVVSSGKRATLTVMSTSETPHLTGGCNLQVAGCNLQPANYTLQRLTTMQPIVKNFDVFPKHFEE